MIDRRKMTKSARQPVAFDHSFRRHGVVSFSPSEGSARERRPFRSTSQAGSSGRGRLSLRCIRKCHIRRHARSEFSFAIVQPNFDAEDLLHALTDSLDVARRELSFPGDLFHRSRKVPIRIRIHSDFYSLAQLDMAEPWFGHVNAHPQML